MDTEEVAVVAATPNILDVFLSWVGFGANLAAIVTAVVAVSVWLSFRHQHKKRRMS